MERSNPPDPPRSPADRTGGEPPARRPVVRTVAGILAATALVGTFLALLVLGIDVLLAAFGGVLVAVFLRALTDLLKRYVPMKDGFALTAVLGLLVLLLGGGGVLLAPQIDAQVQEWGETIPEAVEQVEGFLQDHAWGRWALGRVRDGEMPEGAPQQVGAFVTGLSEWGTWALTAFFVGLFAAANPNMYREAIAGLFPLARRQRAGEVLDAIGYTLRWWLIGQALAMIVIGVSTTLVLWAFGVPLAVVAGLIVGLLGFIPYLGPFIGAVPVALLAVTQGADTLAYVLAAYTVVQLVEGYIITPVIQHRAVTLPPVFTIVAQVLLGTVVGALGVVLATPLAAVALVLTRFYKADFLGDPEVLGDEQPV